MVNSSTKKASDYVLATGKTTSVRDFVSKCFNEVGIQISFTGKDEKEVGRVEKCTGNYKLEIGKKVVEVSSKYYRPTEVDLLIGDSSKAQKELGWKIKYSIDDIIKEMINAELNLTK